MKIRLERRTDLAAGDSPYRVVSEPGGEISWVNRFLDVQRLRGVTELSLRGYGGAWVHFLRWWAQQGVDVTRLEAGHFNEATVLDYIRAQRGQKPPPVEETINLRVTLMRRLSTGLDAPARPSQRQYDSHLCGGQPARLAAPVSSRL